MKLKYVSITGADDAVNVDDLSALAAEFPYLECAILCMPEDMGIKRFPTTEWIKDFSNRYTGAHTAMHLCGDAFLRFIEGDAEIFELMRGFNRIQLNLKFGDVEGQYDPSDLIKRVQKSRPWQFIIQYGSDKVGLLPALRNVENHAVLFDESAGRGVSPDSWEAPLKGHFCGYAGGLNPDNVQENIEMIAKVAPDYTTWIDMETGVRTGDVFDLAKVRSVLEVAKPYCA